MSCVPLVTDKLKFRLNKIKVPNKKIRFSSEYLKYTLGRGLRSVYK